MSYDLRPSNSQAGEFRFGAFSFPVLLEACGYLFPSVHNGGQWYCVFGVDPRMPQGENYPRILSNDGFKVTAEEARIMARIARNLVAVQRSLPEEHRGTLTPATQTSFKRKDVEQMLLRAMSGAQAGPWPVKIRDDFTDLFERFADWAPRSGGFQIW